MAIDAPISDTSRAIMHDKSLEWPDSVKLQMIWKDTDGRAAVRTEIISADEFFGLGQFGAPMDGARLISMIERLRRAGPPAFERKVRR